MNANKLFSEFSLKKIWDKLIQHDKAMNSTLLVLSSGNWEEQEDGTFKNTVSYSSFKETDKLTVDLYDDGNLSETALVEYEQYINEFDIIDGALVATANTKPTQTMTIVVKGDFEVDAVVGDITQLIEDVSKLNSKIFDASNYTLSELFSMTKDNFNVPCVCFCNWDSPIASMMNSQNAFLLINHWTCIAVTYTGELFRTNSESLIFETISQNSSEDINQLSSTIGNMSTRLVALESKFSNYQPVQSLSGSYTIGSIAPDGGHHVDKVITFNPAFGTIPTVTARITTDHKYAYISVEDITQGSCVIKVTNGHSTQTYSNIGVAWSAVANA